MSIRELLRAGGLDVRYALRGYRSAPAFAVGTVLTLALGIGVNVAMFSITDRLLLRPPAHVRDPGTVRRLYFTIATPTGPLTTASASYPVYAALRADGSPFAAVAAYSITRTSIGRGAAARPAVVSNSTSTMFSLLGASPARGRYFDAQEDRLPSGTPVAVISYATWQHDFAGDENVIGRAIAIGAREYQIIGVARAGFTAADLRPIDAWIPLTVGGTDALGPSWYQNSGIDWLQIVVRLPVTVSATDAAAFASRTIAAVKASAGGPAARPGETPRPPVASLGPMARAIGPNRPKEVGVAVWLVAMSAIVLLITCANVANLLLVRTLRRRREIAIRVAMGISKMRLVLLLLVDGFLLAVIGGGIGAVLGRLSAGVIGRLLLPDVDWEWLPFDARFAAFALLIVLVVGAAISIVPALQRTAPRTIDILRSGTATAGSENAVARLCLVASQSALCTFMLIGAGLFIHSLSRARQVDAGFDSDRVVAVTVRLRDAGYSPADASQFFARARERIGAIPGVEHAAVALAAPFVLTLQTPPRIAPPYTLPAGEDAPYLNAIDADYLQTMGIRVVRGRGIEREDVSAHRDVALVNERMAARVWPGSDAIGKCMRFGSDTTPCITVVGVVRDVRQRELLEEPTLQYYVPIGPRFDNQLGRVLLVRAVQEPDALVAAVRKEIVGLAPRIPYADIRPYSAILEPELRSWHLGAVLFTLFAALAALVAAIGLYSVVSYATAQRRSELALRVALGARPFAVARVVVRGSVLPCLAGVGAGLGLAVLASRRVQPLLFQTSATDPRVFAAVAVLLVGVGLLSVAAPAVRAIRADPVLALREQ